MTIHPVLPKGQNIAIAHCDGCGHEERLRCNYERHSARRKDDPGQPIQGQANKKLIASGWAVLRGRHFCPSCNAKHKAEKEAPEMSAKTTNVAPIRAADREQKRLIILALEDAYDAAAGKYIGRATDKTLAEDLGAGIMPGWVADLREEFFGPAGNEELDQLRAEVDQLTREAAQIRFNFDEAVKNFTKVCDKQYREPIDKITKQLEGLSARIEGCVSSHDKRVRA